MNKTSIFVRKIFYWMCADTSSTFFRSTTVQHPCKRDNFQQYKQFPLSSVAEQEQQQQHGQVEADGYFKPID